jgi:dienelactone hydrolase
MSITTKPVEYMDGKTKCIGYLAWDETYADPKPCVIVSHAWGGRDSFAEDKAIQMAALGYVGFALDNYGNGALPESVDDKMAMMGPLKEDRAALLKRMKAGVKAAQKLPEVDEKNMAMIGFCFGGLGALDMARSGADLKAAISFHGLLDAPDLPKKKIKAKVLICHGWDDPMAPPNTVIDVSEEMTKAGCDWQLHSYGKTTHAFTVPEANMPEMGLQYNADSDRRSWAATLDLLSEVFGNHGIS